MKGKFQHGGVLLFIIFFIALILPVLKFRFFLTVDGPAHLYNATIIREMLTGDQSLYTLFFKFNEQLVPNWSGHFLMMLAGFIVPPWIAEKLVLLLIMISLPYVIYRILKTRNIPINGSLLLILPFTFTLVFYLGFYNYLLGIAMMLWMMHLITQQTGPVSKTTCWQLLSGSLILYFTHLLPLLLLMLFTGVYLLFYFRMFSNPVRTASTFALAFLPAVVLAIIFMSKRGLEGYQGKVNSIPSGQLFEWLYLGQPFIGLNGDQEQTGVFVLMVALLMAFVITIYRNITTKPDTDSRIWLWMALIILVCYFIVPNGMASGGFISLRLLLLFYLLVVIYILMNQRPAWMNAILGIAGIVASFYAFEYRNDVAKEQNNFANDFIEAASELPQRSVVLPLNYSGNWLHTNISNYMGAVPGIVVLDNYEAKFNEFPLQWKQNGVVDSLGNFGQSLNPTITIENYENLTGVKVTAVTRFKYIPNKDDTISEATNKLLLEKFRLVKKINLTEIFIRR
ncbi:MAG: hypothetical protein IPL22_21295 [Bacteroidetes bacterium]|nr:hypothetical protein [Bacteroidota bacterium]